MSHAAQPHAAYETPPICGVDEAGRGPLAGPVVVAAVILDPAHPMAGLGDSKALAEADREALYPLILAHAAVSVVAVGPQRIDTLNIRGATLWGMARAVAALPVRPERALIDGRDVPPGLAVPGDAVVGGDTSEPAIGAASIVAKVTRDRLMVRLCRAFPHYGFSRHKGYPTPEHRAALLAHGPSPHHRMSFAPVRAVLRPAVTCAASSHRPQAEAATHLTRTPLPI